MKIVDVSHSTKKNASTNSVGADVALRSLDHLQQIEKTEKGGAKLKAAVVSVLLGLALIGAAKPAHADTTIVQQPTAQELFLDGHMPTGPPDYARLLGNDTVTYRTADARTKAAFDAFDVRLTQILQRDAGSLAQGLAPIDNGASLNAVKMKELEHALGDLVKELPVSVLSSDARSAVERIVGRSIEGKRLGELGDVGSDAARDLVKRLRSESPKTFWSLAGTAAAAAVAVGYTQGTDGLEKLGIKPELSTKVFDGVKLKLGLEAQAKLKDPRVSLGVEGSHTFDGGTVLKGGISAQVHAKSVVSAELNGNIVSGGFVVDGAVRLDGNGKPFDARLSVAQSFGHTISGGGNAILFGGGQWSNGTNGTVEQGIVTLGAGATHGRWTTSVTGTWDLHNDRFSSTLATGRTYDVNTKNDLDVQVRATHDSQGATRVGVGVTLRF
jgi:hypothetical protein